MTSTVLCVCNLLRLPFREIESHERDKYIFFKLESTDFYFQSEKGYLLHIKEKKLFHYPIVYVANSKCGTSVVLQDCKYFIGSFLGFLKYDVHRNTS